MHGLRTICFLHFCGAFLCYTPCKRVASFKLWMKSGYETNNVFIFGLGYVGLRCARMLCSRGYSVQGTCRSEQGVEAISTESNGLIQAYVFSRKTPLSAEAASALEKSSYILSTIPPDSESDDPVLQHFESYSDSIKSKLMLGYFSSTTIYGNHDGNWVDESSPTLFNVAKAASRSTAENRWKTLELFGSPVHIFRLSGIYGPNRSALQTVVKNNGNLSSVGLDNCSYVSRIHIDDITQYVLLTIQHCRDFQSGQVVNLSDNYPSTKYEVKTKRIL